MTTVISAKSPGKKSRPVPPATGGIRRFARWPGVRGSLLWQKTLAPFTGKRSPWADAKEEFWPLKDLSTEALLQDKVLMAVSALWLVMVGATLYLP